MKARTKPFCRATFDAALLLAFTAVTPTPSPAQEPGRGFSGPPEQGQPRDMRGPGEPGMMPFAPGGMTPQTLPELDRLKVSPADKDGMVAVSADDEKFRRPSRRDLAPFGAGT